MEFEGPHDLQAKGLIGHPSSRYHCAHSQCSNIPGIEFAMESGLPAG